MVTERHPDAELTVVRRWASGTTHLAWVGGWEHSVDITEVLGRSVVVARPPLPTLCGVVLRGRWPFKQAGDLVLCMDDDRATCPRCRRAAAVKTVTVDAAVSRVFGRFGGDTWREQALRDVVTVALEGVGE